MRDTAIPLTFAGKVPLFQQYGRYRKPGCRFSTGITFPGGWVLKRQVNLGDVAAVQGGLPLRKGVEPIPTGSHFLLQIRDFNPERTAVAGRTMVRVSAPSIRQEQVLREKDIVFLAKGGRNFSFVMSDLPGPTLAAPYFFVLRARKDVLPEYLAWFLNQESTKRRLSRLTGTRMPVVRRDALEKIELPLPDLATQRRIVELESLMRRQCMLLDELAEKMKTLAALACMRAATQSTNQEQPHE